MKKKLLALLIAVVSVFSFAFAACGGDNNSNNENSGNNESNGADDKITLTKDTDFGALVSEKVDEAGWKAAFNDDNYVSYKSILKMTEDGDTEVDTFSVQQTDSIKILEGVNPNGHFFYGLDDTNLYVYAIDSEDEELHFEVVPVDSEEAEPEVFKWYVSLTIFCPEFSKHFDKFTYNETTGAYEFSDSENCLESFLPFTYSGDEEYNYVSVKIINGQLAYMKAICYDIELEIKFFDYGTTSVTIPQDIKDAMKG